MSVKSKKNRRSRRRHKEGNESGNLENATVAEKISHHKEDFENAWGELNNITWPSSTETIVGTMVTLFVLIMSSAVLGVFSRLFDWIYG